MADVKNCIETIDDAERIATAVVKMVQAKSFGLSQLPAVFDILKDAGDFARDLGQLWPELKDLDAQEAGQIASRLYEMGTKLYEQITGVSVASLAAAVSEPVASPEQKEEPKKEEEKKDESK